MHWLHKCNFGNDPYLNMANPKSNLGIARKNTRETQAKAKFENLVSSKVLECWNFEEKTDMEILVTSFEIISKCVSTELRKNAIKSA